MKTLFEILQQFGQVYEYLPEQGAKLSELLPFWIVGASRWQWNPERFGADLSSEIRIAAVYYFLIDPSQSEIEQVNELYFKIVKALNEVDYFEDSKGHPYLLRRIEAEMSLQALQRIQLQHKNLRALGIQLIFYSPQPILL